MHLLLLSVTSLLPHKLRDVAKLEMCQADSQLTDARPKEVKVN